MQHGDAPGSGKGRRQRKVAALGAAGDEARKLLELGDALDDAVRAMRTGDALAEGLCRRVHELWSAQRAHVLEWHPTELRAAGKLVLAASAEAGRYVLPAFSSGLRALAMREQCLPADVQRLAQHLAALESYELDAQGFAAWLWRGGALGFDAAQHENVFELGEGLIGEIDEAAHWTARSQQAVSVWNDLAWKSAQAFGAAAIAEHFRVPVERLEQRLRTGELSLSDDEVCALRGQADDEPAFAAAEVGLMLQHPALRATLPGAHVSWRVATLIESSPELARVPDLLARLAAIEPGNAGALDARILGEAFGKRLATGGLDLRVLAAAAAQFGPELLTGMLGYLAQRDHCGPEVEAVLCQLIAQGGLHGLLGRVDVTRMQAPFAIALLRGALGARVAVAELVAIFERLPARSLLGALSALPTLLRVAEPTLHALIAERPREVEPLLAGFVRSAPAAAQSAGRGLLRVHGAGFSSEGLVPILGALVEVGLGRELVIPLWESRKAQAGVRLSALAALEDAPELLEEALRRREVDGLDPAEIRIAVEELRWRQP